MRHNLFTLALMLSAVLFGSFAQAGIIYSTDFNSDADGTTPDGFLHVGGTGSATEVQSGVLELTSRSNTGNYAFGNFDGSALAPVPAFESLVTFSFDATFADTNTQQLRLRARDTGFSGGTTDTVRFDLNQSDVTVGTAATYDYVVNNSTVAALAPKTGTAIAAGSYEIFQNGTSIASGANFTAADNLAVDKLTLWVLGTTGATPAQGTVQIDNFAVHTSAVPEPSSLALLGLGVAFVGFRRRRN